MVPDYCEATLEVKDMDYIENKLKIFKEKNDYDISIEEKDGIVKAIAKDLLLMEALLKKEKCYYYLMLFYEKYLIAIVIF